MIRSIRYIAYSSPLLLALNVGCSGDATPDDGAGGDHITAKGAALLRAQSCEDLLWQIQRDAIAKLDVQVEHFREAIAEGQGFYGPAVLDGGWAESDSGGDLAVDTPTSGSTGSNGGSTGSNGGDGSSAPGSDGGGAERGDSPDSFSDTNTQITGVDEADIVKTDGERIYVLHGNEFKILDSWPAEELSELGSVEVESGGFEMFVAGGFATLFSNVQVPDLPSEGSDGSKTSAADCYDCCDSGGESFTKIATYDVTGNAPVLLREVIVEGSYVSGRRHGEAVRAIVRGGFSAPGLYYPDIEPYDTFGREKSEERLKEDLLAWRNEVARDIETTTLDDWIPRRFRRESEAWVALDPQCDSYFVPQPGLVESGVTQVVTLDLEGKAEPEFTAVLGGSDQVYANHTTMVLAQVDWGWFNFGSGEGQRSIFHSFDLNESKTQYQASGFVPGVIENQFSMDVRDGVLRVSTTEDVAADPEEPWITATENRVVTLKPSGGELSILDRSEPFGHEGERIFSTRFLGDRAYVVTFRQTDPLVVLDLKDPANIEILGELEIPGFSEYIHPLDDNHLLTIGMNGENGGTDQVALQIFDVSEPTSPRQSHVELFGSGSSEAVYNHKAFTFVDDYFAEGEDLLLFPLLTYYPEYQSGLEVVKVSATDGVTRLGMIDHTALVNGGCGQQFGEFYPCFYGGTDEMRRGIQIDDYIYALSQGGITVHDIMALDSPAIATVEFEAPVYRSTACYYEDSWGPAIEPGPAPDIDFEAGAGGGSAVGGSTGM